MESTFPSLNLFYNQSFYKDFNYYNYSFENVNTQKFYGSLNLEKLNTNVEANLYNIENYVYVANDFRPKQLMEVLLCSSFVPIIYFPTEIQLENYCAISESDQ